MESNKLLGASLEAFSMQIEEKHVELLLQCVHS